MKKIRLPDGSIGQFPDEMPDEEIAAILTEQFPEPQEPNQPDLSLGEVPSAVLRNAPRSAANFAGDIYHAVTNPVQTAKGVRDVVGGGLRNLVNMASPSALELIDRASSETPEELSRREEVAGAAGQYLKGRYGGVQETLNTIGRDPVGALSDLSTVFTGGAMAAPKAGQVAATLNKAARLTDPVWLAGKGVAGAANAAGNVAANFAGNLSGVTGDPLKIAYSAGVEGGDAGKAFRANMRGAVEPEVVVNQARQNLENIRTNISEQYKADKNVWAASPTPIRFDPIETAYANLVNSTTEKGFSKLTAADQAVLQKVGDKIAEFKANGNFTVADLDALKQAISNIVPDSPAHTQQSRILSTMRSAIKREIGRQAPAYEKAMRKYSVGLDKVDEIEKSLSLGDRASTDTALRKLTSLTRNNANTNYGQRLRVAERLVDEGGIPIMPQLAGQALNTWMPRGIQGATAVPTTVAAASLAHPAFLAGLAAESPRMSGEIAHLIGIGARYPTRAAKAVAPAAPYASRGLSGLQSISDLYQEDEALRELKRRR